MASCRPCAARRACRRRRRCTPASRRSRRRCRRRVAGMLRLDHLADRAALHHLVERLRLRRSSWRRSCGRACTGRGSGSGGAPAPGRRPASRERLLDEAEVVGARLRRSGRETRWICWLIVAMADLASVGCVEALDALAAGGQALQVLEGAGGVGDQLRPRRRRASLRRTPSTPCGAAACRCRRAGRGRAA